MGNNHSRKKKRYEVRASDAVTDDANPPAPISQPDSSPPSEKRTEKLKKDKVSKKNSKKFWKVADPPEKKPGEDEEKCSVCLFELKASGDEEQMPVVQLTKCSHYFHKDCVKHCVDKEHLKCPICGTHYGIMIGNQPSGSMNVSTNSSQHLPGYEKFGTITYYFGNGTQGPEHYHPGQHYEGTSRTGYFPDCPEGKAVVDLLRIAWKRKLLFTVGTSVTHGTGIVLLNFANNFIWNGIHHKTAIDGGAASHGYPDPSYLARVTNELAAFGVVSDEDDP